MTFGLRIKANDSGAVFDTSSNVAGFALVDSFRVADGVSGSKTYPELAGFTIFTNEIAEASLVWNNQHIGVHTVTVDMVVEGGVTCPRVNYTDAARGAPFTRIYVFAT